MSIDINEFGDWTLETHGVKLNMSEAKYVEYLLGKRECPGWTRWRKLPVLLKLLKEYREVGK